MWLNSDNEIKKQIEQKSFPKKIEDHMKHISSFTFLTLFWLRNLWPDKIIEILEQSRNNK